MDIVKNAAMLISPDHHMFYRWSFPQSSYILKQNTTYCNTRTTVSTIYVQHMYTSAYSHKTTTYNERINELSQHTMYTQYTCTCVYIQYTSMYMYIHNEYVHACTYNTHVHTCTHNIHVHACTHVHMYIHTPWHGSSTEDL